MFRTLLGFSVLLSVPILALACESSDGGDELLQSAPVSQRPPTAITPPSSRPEREIVRKNIGQQGGTIEGEGASITIPEGALAQDTLIIIKEVDPLDVQPPLRGAFAGKVYAFEPDSVTFAKPVTISITTDPARRPANGAVVLLRSPKALSQWETKGGGAASQPTITAVTDHFSDWVAFAIPEESCLLGTTTCSGATDAGPLECRMPASTPGVSCALQSDGKYNCTCTGGAISIATFDQGVPTDSALSALAAACGASCEQVDAGEATDADVPPTDAGTDPDAALCPATASCTIVQDPLPDGGSGDGWTCSTSESTTTIPLHCRHTYNHGTAECTCDEETDASNPALDAGSSFTIFVTNNTPPTEAAFVQMWRDRCGGICTSASASSDAGDASTD